jgi:site-specific DNA recombinase
MGKKVVLYARVSTDEQRDNGFSLQDQIGRMQKYCRSNDYDILQILEEDHSAKNFNRPKFQQFLNELKEGAIKPSFLVCVRPDRYSRNVQESFGMFATLRKWGVEVKFLESHVDVNTPEDKLLLYINQILPEIDNESRSLNVTRGMRQAQKEGRWMGLPLRGYKKERVNNTSLMIPNEKAKVIIEGFEMFASGLYSQEEVRQKMRTLGVPLFKFQIKNVLTNIAYTGVILIPAWKDETEV